MLGWDVGYVWPLLEGVVATQVQPPSDHWQLVMGNPHEAASNNNNNNHRTTTTATHNHGEPSSRRSTSGPRTRDGNEPPPYERINSETSSTQSQREVTSGRELRRNAFSEAIRDHGRTVGARNRRPAEDARRLRPTKWPHRASSTFACLSCVVGLCNLSRFSLLVNIYKGCFIFQFFLLSIFIGIPFLYLQMTLGQYLGAGLLDMWHISPAFKGLGFAMLYMYVILGVYQAIPLSWLFVYFKDSFITLKDSYKWGKCNFDFGRSVCIRALNSSSAEFYGWTVPSYFHGRVLGRKPGEFQVGELKFEIAFNLCLVWLIIFICLSRGPKTFGKVIYIFGVLPIALLMMVTMRMGQQWREGIADIVSSPWKPILIDPSAWSLAAREVFITWCLLGAVAMHICSHNKSSANLTKNLIAISATAISVLVMSAMLFSCTINVFHSRNLSPSISSYEEESTINVLKPSVEHHENVTVTTLILGESIIPKDKVPYRSGYQVLRLATETFPAALAVEGVRNISSFWSICFYTAMIMFGFGQQIVLWYCVVESVIAINYKVLKAWHTTLTFLTCNIAFLFGLPITSNIGIYIVYFLDFAIGSLWWIIMMYLVTLFSILYIRGRPYATEQLVTMISRNPIRRSKILPLLTFQWNIVLPVSFLVLTISFLRSSSVDPGSEMGRLMDHYTYWHRWAKTLNLCIQMFPLVLIIAVCAYQTFRIFSSKPELPFMERLKLLCCPPLPLPSASSRQSSVNSTSSLSEGSTNSGFVDDPPPKYTPPPSYSTATSRILAKQLEDQRQRLAADSCTVDLDASAGGTNPPLQSGRTTTAAQSG